MSEQDLAEIRKAVEGMFDGCGAEVPVTIGMLRATLIDLVSILVDSTPVSRQEIESISDRLNNVELMSI